MTLIKAEQQLQGSGAAVQIDDEITESFVDEVAPVFISVTQQGEPQRTYLGGKVFGDTIFWLDRKKAFNIAGKTAQDIQLGRSHDPNGNLFYDEFVLPLIRAFDDALDEMGIYFVYGAGMHMQELCTTEVIFHEVGRGDQIHLLSL